MTRAAAIPSLVLALSVVAGACGGTDEADASDTSIADTAADTADTAASADSVPQDTADTAVGDTAPADTSPPPECGPGSTSPSATPCNDFKPCTVDSCVEGRCVHTDAPDCCTTDEQCADEIDCTDERCNLSTNTCIISRQDNLCCLTASDCDDSDECTADVCVGNACVFPQTGACEAVNPVLCEDRNSCTSHQWSDKICSYTPLSDPGCCADDAACAGDDNTTVGHCELSRCVRLPRTCSAEVDCAGLSTCTTGTCDGGQCVYPASCCEVDSQCDDAVDATADLCVDNRCVHTLDDRTCTIDSECGGVTGCSAWSCVRGRCSVAAASGEGCCQVPADCTAVAVCDAPTCVDFTCGEASSGDPWRFAGATFDDAATLTAWTITADTTGAKWQWSGNQAASPPGSLYYGALPAENIDVGRNKGTATSPVWALPEGRSANGLRLRFWRRIMVEPGEARDVLTLEVLPATGDAVQIWDKGHNSGPGFDWRLDEVALPDGLTFPIRLRFDFDSIDGVSNEGAGIFVDDIELLLPCE